MIKTKRAEETHWESEGEKVLPIVSVCHAETRDDDDDDVDKIDDSKNGVDFQRGFGSQSDDGR